MPHSNQILDGHHGMKASAVLAGTIALCAVASWLVGCSSGSSGQKPNDGGGTGGAADASHSGSGGSGVPDAGGSGGRDAGSTGDTAGNPDGGAGAAFLGGACNADADCGPSLICLKATDKVIGVAGGPAHGYCSTRCVPALVDPCTAIGGVCFEYQPMTGGPSEAYCMKSCTFGGTTLDDRVAKCRNRPDVACVQGNGTDFCLPTCSQDVDCPGTRKCDLQFNICVDIAPTGDRMGTHCTVNATAGTSNCAGTCLQFGTATMVNQSVCSSRCVLGELGGCNWVDQTMSVADGTHGVCAFSSGANAFAGDLGFCTPECDGNAGCIDTADQAICDLSIVTDVGHGGCSFATPTPDGGADARVDGGRG